MVRDKYNLKVAQIRVYNNFTKSNPDHKPYRCTKQHAIMNIQLNIVACTTYKYLRDMLHRLYNCVIIVTLLLECGLNVTGSKLDLFWY